jgi:hypothetical protein
MGFRRLKDAGERFGATCRIVYNVGFLTKFYAMCFTYLLLGRRHAPMEVKWGLPEWIGEVQRWPEGADKHEQLYNLFLSQGDDTAAAEQLNRLSSYYSLDSSGEVADALKPLLGPLNRVRYQRLVQRIRQVVEETVPARERLIVVSKGDEDLVRLNGRRAWHFPQAKDGVYAGYYPGSSADAITHLEALRERGASYFLLPGTALWWLETYPEFRDHLESQYNLVFDEGETCLIWCAKSRVTQSSSRGNYGIGKPA